MKCCDIYDSPQTKPEEVEHREKIGPELLIVGVGRLLFSPLVKFLMRPGRAEEKRIYQSERSVG